MQTFAGILLALAVAAPTVARADAAAPVPSRARARADAAAETYRQVVARYSAGMDVIEHVYLWSLRWSQSDTAKDAAQAHLARMVEPEATAKQRAAAGITPSVDVTAATWYR